MTIPQLNVTPVNRRWMTLLHSFGLFSVLALTMIIDTRHATAAVFPRSDDPRIRPYEAAPAPDNNGSPAPSGPEDLTFSMDAIVVNLNEEDSIRYLKLRMDLEMNSGAARTEIERKQPQLRDEANLYLSGLSYDQVKGTQEKVALKEELLRRFNATLTSGRISRIYFVEFVIQ